MATKYVLFYVYGDDDDTPYIIIDPPANLRELLAEWNALDRSADPPDANPEWDYVNEWLKKKGVNVIEADESVFLDDCHKPDEEPAKPEVVVQPEPIPVMAEVHSDDWKAQAGFDASPWFDQATDEEIRALADVDWGGDYEADRVAQFCEDLDQQVAAVFTYAQTAGTGFECHVEEQDALKYLEARRPALFAELTAE